MTLSIPYGQRLPLAIAALGFLFLGLFLLYPLFNVFSASLLDAEGERLTLANYIKVLGRPFYRTAILNTLGIGLAATVITTALAVPFAFALARLPIPGKAGILAMAALPLVLPSFVSAYAIVLLLGHSGIVTQWLQSWGVGFGSIYGAGGIVLVYTLTLYPYVLLPTIAAFKAVDVSMEEAAQGLGSSPRRTVWTVTLPIVLPAVLAAKSLGIPTATMVFSWDNLTSKGRVAAPFDHYMVWSDHMRDDLRRYHPDISLDRIHVVGSPQFDVYADATGSRRCSQRTLHGIAAPCCLRTRRTAACRRRECDRERCRGGSGGDRRACGRSRPCNGRMEPPPVLCSSGCPS